MNTEAFFIAKKREMPAFIRQQKQTTDWMLCFPCKYTVSQRQGIRDFFENIRDNYKKISKFSCHASLFMIP